MLPLLANKDEYNLFDLFFAIMNDLNFLLSSAVFFHHILIVMCKMC